MSRDGTYILSYEHQWYTHPTPMELDKDIIKSQSPEVEFNNLDNGFTIHFEMPKYTLLNSTRTKLKADVILESVDGGVYKEM